MSEGALGLSEGFMLLWLQKMLRYLYILSASTVLMSSGSILIDFLPSPYFVFCRLPLERIDAILVSLEEESLRVRDLVSSKERSRSLLEYRLFWELILS